MTSAREIVAAVAQEHGLAVSEVTGKGRRRAVVRARREAVLRIVAALPEQSLCWVGRQVGLHPSVVGYHLGRYYRKRGSLPTDVRWPEKERVVREVPTMDPDPGRLFAEDLVRELDGCPQDK